MTTSFVHAIAFTVTYASPKPTPTPTSKIAQSSSTQIFNSAFYGAVVGAAATVLAELIVRIIGNYRSYRFIVGLIREEVTEIAEQVEVRKNHLDIMVPLYEPFSTKAWETLIQAQQRRYMREGRRNSLNKLYQAVSIANEHLRMIPTALQISQLASDQQVRDTYRDETIRLLKNPLEAIETALPHACTALKIVNVRHNALTAKTGGKA